MKVINISNKKYSMLEMLQLPSDVLNTEAKMFVFDSKDKWNKNKKVFKKLFVDEGEMFSNKLYTIHEEIDKKDDIAMDELVLAEHLISVNQKVVGFTMPYIENINLKTVLSSSSFSVKEKLEYLKQIGVILEKMKNVREYNDVSNFYLNDLHTSNFILNLNTNMINVVDMDSARIGNNLAQPSKYLTSRSPIMDISKYKRNDNSLGGVFEIDYNTEIYCYIVVIFEYLMKEKITDISILDYYMYLEYLKDLGVSNELIDKLSLIYSLKDNENPYEYLDEFENIYGKTSNLAFKAARKRLFYFDK